MQGARDASLGHHNWISADFVEHFDTDPQLSMVIEDQLEAGAFNFPLSHVSLSHLGDALELPCAQRIENNAHVFRVTREINEHVNAARFYVSGPYGRRVAIGTPDIDLVVFLIVDLKSGADQNIIEAPDVLLNGLKDHLAHKFASNPSISVFPISTANRWPDDDRFVAEQQFSLTTPPYLPLRCAHARFRIFLAPALAADPEEQRQAAYKLIERVRARKGDKEIVRLYPALFERPSEDVACERPEIHAFCRVCQYWVRLQSIKTLDLQATEILAILAARQTLARPPDREGFTSQAIDVDSTPTTTMVNHDILSNCETRTPIYRANTLDFYTAFVTFLQYCAALDRLPLKLTAAIQPACPVDSSTLHPNTYIINDEFNPYRNLLATLSQEDLKCFIQRARGTLDLIQNNEASRCYTTLDTPKETHRENTSDASFTSIVRTCPDSTPVKLKDVFKYRLTSSVSNQTRYQTNAVKKSIWRFLFPCCNDGSSTWLHKSIISSTWQTVRVVMMILAIFALLVSLYMKSDMSLVRQWITEAYEELLPLMTSLVEDVNTVVSDGYSFIKPYISLYRAKLKSLYQ